jgi:SAM-dependent methyltransferase
VSAGTHETGPGSSALSEAGQRQKDHYEAIHDAYEDAYFDAASMAYRERFIYGPLFAGLALDGLDVAELASGSGLNSLALRRRAPGVRLTGFDVSAQACAAYRRYVGRPAVECDLTLPLATQLRFDCAFVIGGLHHCVRNLGQALANAAGLLRPGGRLLMVEPNSDYLLEGLRRRWYRADRQYFDAATEHALAHDEIARLAAPSFVPERVEFLGGPGYFLVLNSLLFRIPSRLKAGIAPPLLAVDSLYNRLPGRAPFPYFVASWRRSGGT